MNLKSILADNAKKVEILPFIVFVLTSIYVIYIDITNYPKLFAYVPDDSFYYFKIAENLLKGYFFSFDTITETNGFHPLWLFLITPLIGIFHKNFVPIILFSSLLFTFGNYVLIKLIKNVFNETLSLIFAILICLNPFVFLFAINGLETGLVYFFVSCFLYTLYSRKFNNYIDFFIFGFVSALLFLSRTDSAFLILIGWGYVILTHVKTNRSKILNLSFNLSLMLIIFFIITTPWLLFNIIKFGSIIQDSGKSIFYQTYHYFDYNHSLDKLPLYVAELFLNNFSWLASFSGFNSIAVLIIVVILFALIYRKELNYRRTGFILIISFYFLLINISSAIRTSPREWYFAIFIPIPILLTSCILSKISKHKLRIFIALIIAVNIIYWNVDKVINGFYPHQVAIKENVEIMNKIFKNNERVGSSDAGIMGFNSNFITVNLDGLVNSDIIPYIKSGNLLDWIEKNNINAFYIRDDWKENWMMGYGSGLRYREEIANIPVSHDKTISIGKTSLLNNNTEIHKTYFKNKISISDQNLNKYFGEGWSTPILPDQKDLWSNKEYSTLFIPLSSHKAYDIVMDLMAINNPDGFINVKVYINDVYVKSFNILSNSYQKYTINIKPPLPMTSKITLIYNKTYNLKKLGISDDDRDLAINIKSISVLEK